MFATTNALQVSITVKYRSLWGGGALKFCKQKCTLLPMDIDFQQPLLNEVPLRVHMYVSEGGGHAVLLLSLCHTFYFLVLIGMIITGVVISRLDPSTNV